MNPQKPMKETMEQTVHVIGAGLAGSECALQLAKRGVSVVLHEERPSTTTPAHKTAECAELVCSNSLKSEKHATAAGALKRELKLMGSELLKIAEDTRVPAGNALAVDRELFSKSVTDAINAQPNIELKRGEVTSLEEHLGNNAYVIIATGPLTNPSLLRDLQDRLNDEEASVLHFYDAAAPIVETASLDFHHIFEQSRYECEGSGIQDGVGDYLNCPLNKEQYISLVKELCAAKTVIKKDFERKEFFQACQPIEEIARTGMDSLRFGPLKPVGLIDPRTGKRPYAALQLRAENEARTAYNLVGFQTNLTFAEQRRIFSRIPGLEDASFMRYGVMHRNSFFDAPRLFNPTFALRDDPRLRFAGQIAGTEGYVEAIASGLYAAINTYAAMQGLQLFLMPTTSLWGALVAYATNPSTKNYQPMHVNFGLLPPLDPPIRNRRERYDAYADRAFRCVESLISSRDDIFALPHIKSSENSRKNYY